MQPLVSYATGSTTQCSFHREFRSLVALYDLWR